MSVRIINGDCREVLRTLPDESVHCCVTSPPYFGLRDYGVAGQMGLEPSPDEFVAGMTKVFREVRRVLRADGTLWLNIGDSYSAHAGQRKTTDVAGIKQQSNVASVGAPSRCADGCKPKDLIGIPWMLAFALRADGWYLRQDIIWSKPNPMPESVTDRCTKAHEYLFLLSKSPRYYFDPAAMQEEATGGIAGNVARQVVPGERVGENANLRNGLHAYAAKQRQRAKDMDVAARSVGSRPHSLGEFEAKSGRMYATRNKRSVWTIATKPFKGAHFATFPPALIEPCILAGCPAGGTVLDPFGGAGTTGLVSERHGRNSVLIELKSEYVDIANNRIAKAKP